MGIVCGKIEKIDMETPKFDVVESRGEYEIRKYGPCVIAEQTYDPTKQKRNEGHTFMILINYLVGSLGLPQRPEKFDKINNMRCSVTPVLQISPATIQFILPEKYKKAKEVPTPVDERVVIREQGERKYGVVRFSGAPKRKVAKKVEKLKKDLESDGFKVVGKHVLGTYNPSCIWPMFWPNELMIPVE